MISSAGQKDSSNQQILLLRNIFLQSRLDSRVQSIIFLFLKLHREMLAGSHDGNGKRALFWNVVIVIHINCKGQPLTMSFILSTLP